MIFPPIHKAPKGGAIIEYGIVIGLIAIVAIVVVVQLGNVGKTLFETTGNTLSANLQNINPKISCNSLFNNGRKTSGFYDIQTKSGMDIPVRCHMVPDGPLKGGWTVILAQIEDTAETDWDHGIYPNKNTQTYFDSAFTLSQNQIPPHKHIAFGHYETSLVVQDAIKGTYTTGDFSLTAKPGLIHSDIIYDAHRSQTASYPFHDPEITPAINDPDNNNTLTFDAREPAVSPEYTWAFNPNKPIPNERGYSYAGHDRSGLIDLSFAWVVLVR